MNTYYFDYASTTPVDLEVVNKMKDCMSIDGTFGNSGSRSHVYGWKAEELVEEARLNVANLINCDSREIIWTSELLSQITLLLKEQPTFIQIKVST